MIRASVSRGIAPCVCPACPEADEVEGVALVGHSENERGCGAFLDAFECQRDHRINDLTAKQIQDTLDSAVEWLEGAAEALMDAKWDAAIDAYRNGDYD